MRKRNDKNEIMRYKSHHVAQDFSQRPEIDYNEMYSPVINAIKFRYLISLAVSENLEMHIMDVVTTYLYGSLDNDIYMKIPEGFKYLKYYVQNSKEFVQLSYNDHYMD